MLRFLIPALLAACSCLAAWPGAAQEGLRLRSTPELLAEPEHNEALPVFFTADVLQGTDDREVEASGDVRLRRRGQALSADQVRYQRQTGELEAAGGVRLEQGPGIAEGDRLRYNLNTRQGVLDNPQFRLEPNRARAGAERLLFEGKDKYRVEEGSFTTCAVGNDDWYLRAKRLDLDDTRGIGVARNATLVFQGVPILYTPWVDFSLDQRRKTGFLAPSIGSTGKGGSEFSMPFYWNIAPNRDATLTPRFIAKRGLMVSNEFRYLAPGYQGEAQVEFLRDDRVTQSNRLGLLLRHAQTFDNGWTGAVNLQKVSDDNYFRDLSNRIAFTSQSHLPREASLAYQGGGWIFGSRVQRFQTLQDPLAPLVPPYHRAPQLTLSSQPREWLGADWAFAGEYADFRHASLPNGRRLIVNPAVSLPLQAPFGALVPKVGVHVTRYSLDAATTALPDQTRSVPMLSLDGSLNFERGMEFRGERLVQTLEPRIFYLYVPFRDQRLVPNFDSAPADVNFSQIFSENSFVGGDRIADANQITLGATSRILSPDSGAERIRFAAAQRYHFKSQEVSLPGFPVRNSTSSDLLAAVSGNMTQHWAAEAGWQYNTDFSQTQKLSTVFRYQPKAGQVLNLGYRYRRDALEQVDVSTQWRLAGRWTGLARWNYSLRETKVLEGLAGLEYNAECWSLRLVAHRFATATQDVVNSVFLQLELGGLSKLGSNPFDVLKQNIFGYDPASGREERAVNP